MLTPNDIAEKKFDKVIMGGYDMGAVDDFLDQLEKDYGTLVNENSVLKNKMKLLVKKIEEYRSMDESMRKALNSAQSMAAQIIDKAKAEAQIIRDNAQSEADRVMAGYEVRIAEEERKLAEAKASVEDFVTRMTTMYSQGAEMLQTVVGKFATDEDFAIPEIKPITPVSAEAQHFHPAKADDLDTEEIIREYTSEEPAKPAVLADTAQLPNLPPVPGAKQGAYTSSKVYPNSVVRPSAQNDFDDEGETILLTPKPKFEFDDLQFGENYDSIKNNKK